MLASVSSRSARSPVVAGGRSWSRVLVVSGLVRLSVPLSRTTLWTIKGHFLTSIARESENMANTSSRTLRLLSLLQTHRYWPGAELAERLGVSVRTLRRDIDRLRELGYPVEASRGVDGGYQLAAGAALPPLVLDDEEAVALAVGLQAAAQGAVAGIAESSVRALAKVRAGDAAPAAPPGRRAARDDGARGVGRRPGAGVDPDVLPRSRRPAGTPNGSSSATRPRAASDTDRQSSRCGWSPSAAAGTSSPTTSPATTGAASGSTGSPEPRAPAPGSGRASCPPRTPRRSSGPGWTAQPARRTPSRCSSTHRRPGTGARRPVGHHRGGPGRALPAAHAGGLAGLAGDGARRDRRGVRGRDAAGTARAGAGLGANVPAGRPPRLSSIQDRSPHDRARPSRAMSKEGPERLRP